MIESRKANPAEILPLPKNEDCWCDRSGLPACELCTRTATALVQGRQRCDRHAKIYTYANE